MQKIILAAVEAVKRAGGVDGRSLEVDRRGHPDRARPGRARRPQADRRQQGRRDPRHLVLLGLPRGPADHQRARTCCCSTSRPRPRSARPAQNAKHLGWRFQAGSPRIGAAYAEIAARYGAKNPAYMAFNNDVQIASTNVFRARLGEARRQDRQVGRLRAEPDQLRRRAADRARRQSGFARRLRLPAGYHDHPARGVRGGEHGQDRHPRLGVRPLAGQGARQRGDRRPHRVRFGPGHRGHGLRRIRCRLYKAAMGVSGLGNVYAAMCYDMVNVLALALQKAGAGAGQRGRCRRHPRDRGPAGTDGHRLRRGQGGAARRARRSTTKAPRGRSTSTRTGTRSPCSASTWSMTASRSGNTS